MIKLYLTLRRLLSPTLLRRVVDKVDLFVGGLSRATYTRISLVNDK